MTAVKQDTDYLISKIGNVDPATKAKALEIIRAANAAGVKIRFVWGMGGPPEHSTGLALDIMTYSREDNEWVRSYVWANRARLRLRHVLCNQTITSTVVSPGVRRKMDDRGSVTDNHYDHNHILFFSGAYVAPKAASTTTSSPAVVKAPVLKSISQIAAEVWAGKWGSGDDRTRRLKAAGYNPALVQSYVNKGVGVRAATSDPKRKTVSQIASEVIAGKWGNGPDRVRRLTRAGYNANAVQAEVNRKL